MNDFLKVKFIEQQLTVHLQRMRNIGLEIKPHGCFIRTSIFLLCGDQPDQWIQIREFKMIRSTEHDIAKNAKVQPSRSIHADVMKDAIFFCILIISQLMLVDEF